MQLAHWCFNCVMAELLFLLLSARCIQTVSSQIERVRLRVPQMTPSFYNNVKVFFRSTLRWFGSWWNSFDSNAILKYCINASSHHKSHKDIFPESTRTAFTTRIQCPRFPLVLYLWPSIFCSSVIYVPKFLHHFHWSMGKGLLFITLNWVSLYLFEWLTKIKVSLLHAVMTPFVGFPINSLSSAMAIW